MLFPEVLAQPHMSAAYNRLDQFKFEQETKAYVHWKNYFTVNVVTRLMTSSELLCVFAFLKNDVLL